MEYKIKSLKDIFELPTADQMNRCLDEVVPFLKTTRAAKEAQDILIRTVAETTGLDIPEDEQIWSFPEEMVWKDDGKGEHQAIFDYGDGQKLNFKTKQEVEDSA